MDHFFLYTTLDIKEKINNVDMKNNKNLLLYFSDYHRDLPF